MEAVHHAKRAKKQKRISILHHAKSGWGDSSERAVLERLEGGGYEVSVLDVKGALCDQLAKSDVDVVIAAGGDGTVLGVARRLAYTEIPMVVLPVGTANNLAHALGARADLDSLMQTLASPRERALDLGVASGSWGERFFSESAGVGWFCDVLDGAIDKEDKAIHRARPRLAETLASYEPRHWTLTIDGRDVSGDYTTIDVMNANMIGPNVCIAPRADPFDGWFDVVLATNHDRERLEQYLHALVADPGAPPPALAVLRAKHVHIALRTEERIRVDGTLCPKRDEAGSHFADISMLPAAVRVWLPDGAPS